MMSGMSYTILPVSTTDFPTGIRYVWIDCTSVQKGDLSLDAVKVEPAPTPTGYGLIVTNIHDKIQNQDEALGEPDSSYATIGYPGGDILLYMGALHTSALTVYHSTTSPSCNIFIGDAQGNVVVAGTTTAGATSTTVDLQGVNIMFVGVQCSGLTKKALFQLDAVKVQEMLP